MLVLPPDGGQVDGSAYRHRQCRFNRESVISEKPPPTLPRREIVAARRVADGDFMHFGTIEQAVDKR